MISYDWNRIKYGEAERDCMEDGTTDMDLLVPGLDMMVIMVVRPIPVKCAAITAALRSHTYSQYSRIPRPSPTGLYSTLDGIPMTQVPGYTA